jgi:hypothetical protein
MKELLTKAEAKSKTTVYPDSLVMESMDNKSWTMLDCITAIITASCLIAGIYYYIERF